MDMLPDSSKKSPLEDLSKEELVKKCRGLLTILQKAKQSKDSLIEENNDLKRKLDETKHSSDVPNAATQELLDNLTQKKLNLVTSIEDIKNQKETIQIRLKECEVNLGKAERKVIELDTENQGYQRQINRLTEENEQLLLDLDNLEKQSDQLKNIGLQQQQQLLELEKNQDIIKELADKNKTIELLKVEYDDIKSNTDELIKENKELVEKNKELIEKQDELVQNIEDVKINYKNAETLISSLRNTIEEKNKQNESYINATDDLNIELHRNKALVEKMRQDLITMSRKLSDNQILSSGIASDLENINEKLKDKLKFFHSKLVKFAGDVKILKEQKNEIINNFKTYFHQVKAWELQLQQFSSKVVDQFKQVEEEKHQLGLENESFMLKTTTLEENILKLRQTNDKLLYDAEVLKRNEKDEVNKLHQEKALFAEEINKSIKQIDELKRNVDNLSSEKILLSEILQNVEGELKILKNEREAEKRDLKNEIQNLHNENESFKFEMGTVAQHAKQFEDQIKNHEDLKTKMDEHKLKLERTLTELELQEQQVTKLTLENNALTGEVTKMVSKSEVDSNKIDDLNEKVHSLQEEVQLLKTTEIRLAEQTANEITKHIEENKHLTERNRSLLGKLETLTVHESKTNIKISNNSIQTDQYDDQIVNIKRENSELLAEMNEMNQVLKERGETISKQQEYCEELLRNIKIYETQSNKNSELVREKNEIIAKLEKDIHTLKDRSENQSTVNFSELHRDLEKKDEALMELRNELLSLKEKINLSHHSLDSSQEVNYAESETMSTSTISRTEEVNRIKDLESSWEERYGKLRTLAIKLKGKIRDLTSELTKEQSEKADLQQKLSNSLKTVQSLQNQCDSVQDELDYNKKELREHVKKLDSAALDISNNKKQLTDNDELIAKLISDIDMLNKEKSNTDSWKKQVSSKVQNLRKELEANALLKKDFENQISKLNTQIEAKDRQLKEEIDKHNTTKSSLQESNNECKKQSVLNLEMQDYERSLKDLTQKLERKQELVNKLKNQLDTQKSTVNILKEQNRLVEERMQNEETDLNEARNEIRAYKKNITEFELLINQKDDKIQDLMRSLENCRIDNEDLSTQLSKLVTENKKIYDQLKSEKDYFRNQNVGLEQKLQVTQENLKLREDELKEIHTEYQSYKVRAQSVLRQNQTRDVGLEEKLSEEVASFKAQVALLTSEVTGLKNSLEKLKEENVKVEIEKEEIEKKYSTLENKLEKQKGEHTTLIAKHQEATADHAEAIRGLKVHAETLAQCYRQQISEQEVRHNREIIELQSKIEKVAPVPEVPAFAPPSIPREQGEGSENTEITSNINTRPVPLDQLLSSEPDQDIDFIKKQVIENEAKVAHLTALLADTEQDLAKHVQMTKLLKEEIRRQQRSVEREKHAENLEYLKNVIFKFATLGSGDERSRLVPVLNTILKFSPEEINKLNLVAKGEGSRGWANYLPTWSPSRTQ